MNRERLSMPDMTNSDRSIVSLNLLKIYFPDFPETEKALQEVGDKLDGADKAAVEADCKALKELLEKANTDTLTDEQVAEIKAGKEKLTESAQKLFTKMYEQAGAAAGAQGDGPQPGANAGAGPAPEGFQGDDVVDGDYKEV